MSIGLFDPDLSSNTAALTVRQAADFFASDALRDATNVILDERDHMQSIIAAALDVRKYQRDYFRTRSQSDLRAAREAEAKLDRLLKD